MILSGILVIDKPRGPSSHQVTAWVRDILGTPAGHSGTLDPMVSGVLVIMLGRAVRLAPVLLREEKEYVALMRLHGDRSREEIERVAAGFVGKIYQRPPRRSAVRRSLRIRTIHELEILEVTERLVLFRVRCESGTYIRSLCHHLGLALGVGAQMQELRRTRSGSFGEDEAYTLHDLADACVLAHEGEKEPLEKMLLSLERAVEDLPKVVIGDKAVDAVCHGAALAGVGVIAREPHRKGDLVAVLTQKGKLVALGEARVSSEHYSPGDPGLVISPRAVLMEPGTYPRGWIKRS
ncbi:MAG: RNA-guided pseudouridylation complex pseudouridine synthase subunit Cbf5 [Methanomicrobiaceae archaeon]|nr:RNA-guided pseudouridylation complex pseudouridine synthase subunit Cbf5 [Methanomicrobiaceae archaeon]